MGLPPPLRILTRAKGFAAFAILELALGIGLTTSAFFVIYAVLLRPLDLPQPDRLVKIEPLSKKTGKTHNTTPGLDFRDLRDQTHSFTAMAAHYAVSKETILLNGRAEEVNVTGVSRGWLETLGIQPLLGRDLFADGADTRGALISYRFWRSRMAGDSAIFSRALQLEGVLYPIRGVMPDAIVFPENTDVWFSVVPENDGSTRTAFNYRVIARLKPGVSPEQAKADLATVAANLERQYPEDNKNRSYTLVDLRETLVGGYRTLLLTLGGAVLLVLAIACANVTNLLLARAMNRRRELAIRMALGGRARHLFSAVLSESLLVAAIGGAGGVLLAVWIRDLIVSANPFSIPRLSEARLDQVVIGFAVLASLICGCITGLLPAWQVWRSDVQAALGQASSRTVTGTGQRLRSALLVAEVTFSVLLLTGAGLLVRSFSRLVSVNPGFRIENLTLMHCDLSVLDAQSGPRKAAFYQDVRENALAFPGIAAAAWTRDLPSIEAGQWGTVFVEGRPKPAPGDTARLSADWHVAGPGFFETLGIPLLMGRTITARDNPAAPHVAVVNAAFVERFFPHENPLGHRFEIGLDRSGPIMIVGVVGNIRQLAEAATPELYLPYLQHMNSFGDLYLAVRTTGGTAPLMTALRSTAATLMPEASVEFTTMDKVLSESIAPARFRTVALGAFASIALALALAGLYAVCAYMAQARTREVGIHMALGARSSDVLRQFVARALALTGAGLALGIFCAFAFRNILASFLFEVPATDWLSYAGTALLVGAGALAASSVPAWRASRTDPALVLREE